MWAFVQTLGRRLVASVASDDTRSAMRIKAQQQSSFT